MNHLSPAEFVDAADGLLPALRLAHVEECARCTSEVAAVRSAIEAARTPQMSEPSPLYWSHMSARIRQRVAEETIVPAWRASWPGAFSLRGLVPIASAVVLVAAVFASTLVTRHGPVPVAPAASAIVGTTSGDLAIEGDGSAAWEMLTSAAAETAIEDAHSAGMSVGTGAVERALQGLNPDELRALERLLQNELRRSGD